MPVRLSHIRAGVKTLEMDLGEGTLCLTYRVGRITPEIVDRVDQVRNIDDIVELLLEWLSSWDMEDDEGQVLPVSEETLRALPMPFLRAIFRFILSDGRENPLAVRPSVAGSFQAAG